MMEQRGTLTRRAVLAGTAAALPMAVMPVVATPARAGAPVGFTIAGAQLLWSGTQIRLTGVAVGDPIVVRKDRPASDYRVLSEQWRANVARISLLPGHWREDRTSALKRLGDEIAAARGAGLFAVIDWHAIGFPDAYAEQPDPAWGLPPNAFDPDLALATTFWSEMARSFGRDPGVIFELWNEPVLDPKLWVSTGRHWPRLKATWLDLIATIRRHSDNLVLASGGQWAHDLLGVSHDAIDDPHTAYAWHCYPADARKADADWTTSLGGLNETRPVMVTEWGFCPDCVVNLRGSVEDFGLPFTRDVLDRLALHSTAWSWTTTAAPAMLKPDWTTPTLYGRFVLQYLQASTSRHRAGSAQPLIRL